jgi:hypothetical protein
MWICNPCPPPAELQLNVVELIVKDISVALS